MDSSRSKPSLLNLEECKYILCYFTRYQDSINHIRVWKRNKHDNDIYHDEEIIQWTIVQFLISNHEEMNDKHYKDDEIHEDFYIH
jgi:hypothetical protein